MRGLYLDLLVNVVLVQLQVFATVVVFVVVIVILLSSRSYVRILQCYNMEAMQSFNIKSLLAT